MARRRLRHLSTARTLHIATAGASLECLVDEPTARSIGVAILIHGFPDCARSFRHQVAPLTAAGFVVVRPSLRGYFPSSLAHDDRYDLVALADDLGAVAGHVSRAQRVHVIGHDWGALIAYVYTARAAHRLATLTTLAVPPLRTALPRWLSPAQLWASRYMLALRRADPARTLGASPLAYIDRLWQRWSPGFSLPPEERAAVHAALAPPEHFAAACAYYRALGRFDRAIFAALIAPRSVPTLCLHGNDDGCVRVATAGGPAPDYERVVVPGAGHFLHQERPALVNAAILRHLTAHPA